MATTEERNQMAQADAARRMRERTPFAEALVQNRVECPSCYDLCVMALSKNNKEMLMDLEPDRRKTRDVTGWKLSLVQHEGRIRLRATFLDPFERELALKKNDRSVWRSHWDVSPACKEAREAAKRRHPAGGSA